MSIISRLSVILGLDTAQFNAGLGQAEGSLNKFSTSAKNIGVGAATAFAAALSFSAKQALEFANEMTELAKANDMAVSSVLEISSALSTAGGKIDNTSKILSSFTNKVDEAAQGSQKTRDKFKELGVSLDDIGKLSEQDLLRKTIDGLAKIEDPIRRNALAFDLLGKGIKGVDLKDFKKDLDAVKGSYDKSEESFRRIEEWGNKIAKSWFDAKVALADFTVAIADSAEKNKEFFSTRNDYARAMYGLPKQNTSVFSPIDTTGRPDFTPVKPPPSRETKISDEAQKALDKIESQRTALMQNLLTIERQTKELGTQKLLQNEILQQFEKGGKYDLIKDEKLKTRLLDLAKEYDIAKATKDVDEARGKAILAFIEQGKELQRQAIEKKRQHAESVDLEVKALETATRRNEYEKQLAGLSDIQREKALSYFDLKEKIVMLGKDPMWQPDQISAITKANQEMIMAEEANKRAQNTFQAGWDRAYNNFKEKASDSFSAGQSAFNSMTSNMESALDKFVETGKLSFSDLTRSIIQDLIKIQIKAQATSFFSSIFGDLFGGLFGGGGGVSASAGAYGIESNPYLNFSGFADGGSPPIGVPSLVGERGPELFVPRTSGTIIPNNQLSSAMGNQPQIIYNGPYIANMNAIDTQSGLQFLAKNKDAVWAANQSAQRSLPMSR